MSTGRNRWLALCALSTIGFTIDFDSTVLSVATPQLATTLHATTAQLQWFGAIYNLSIAIFLLPAGMLGDRFGRKRLLVSFTIFFGIASTLCGYAHTPVEFIAARGILGLASGFCLPLTFGMLPILFPDEKKRTQALMFYLGATILGMSTAPTFGAWILGRFWPGSVFLISLPFLLAVIVVMKFCLPESKSTKPRPLDFRGLALSSIGLLGITYGFISVGYRGWTDTHTTVPFFIGILLLTLFLLWQGRCAHPLVELNIFRNINFSFGTLLAAFTIFTMAGTYFAVPLFLQTVQGANSFEVGIRFAPFVAGMLISLQIAKRAKSAKSAVSFIAWAFLCSLVGFTCAATFTRVDTPYLLCEFWILVIGLGAGIIMPGTANAALSALDSERSSSGSALMFVIRQIGGTAGFAILGTILNGSYRTHLDGVALPQSIQNVATDSALAGVTAAQQSGSPFAVVAIRSAFVHGFDLMLGATAVFAGIGMILSLIWLRRLSAISEKELALPAAEAESFTA